MAKMYKSKALKYPRAVWALAQLDGTILLFEADTAYTAFDFERDDGKKLPAGEVGQLVMTIAQGNKRARYMAAVTAVRLIG